MCRLLALTDTSFEMSMRRLFFNQLMLISNADGQRDGAGMTDGDVLLKSHHPYINMGAEWVSRLSVADVIWMGHVRAASKGTDVTPYAAHPFRFELNNATALYTAHNGFIRGMPKSEADEPHSDSYQAFKKLVDLMNAQDTPAITRDLINSWIADFGADSEWAHMIHYQRNLTVLRGNRTMYYMQFGNGFVFNTSNTVLLHFKEWVYAYWGKRYRIGRIEEVREFQMFTVAPGSHDLALIPLQKPVMPPNYADMYYQFSAGHEQLIKQ